VSVRSPAPKKTRYNTDCTLGTGASQLAVALRVQIRGCGLFLNVLDPSIERRP
jgi:hypothetical protein